MHSARYLTFLRGNARFLGFGFLAAFTSSFGQTYFIAVFGPSLQAEFDLGHGEWGAIYLLGTLASALLLPFSGKLIDRVPLERYTLVVGLLLAGACAATAAVAGIGGLVLAVFLLRQSGQGLMSHTALTSMARYYDAGRGRAVALASLGFSAGEALLPLVGVLLIAALGWRGSYVLMSLVTLLVLLPALLWLLRGHGRRHARHVERLAAPPAAGVPPPGRSWTRAEVLRDRRFFLLLPGITAPSIIVTALFFHHLNIADAKGWSHEFITGSYLLYALATTLTLLFVGPLIDRLGARRVAPQMLWPLALSMVLLAYGSAWWTAWPYLLLLGINSGLAHAAITALWPEIYGVGYLGAVRSMETALRVFGTALGPVLVGLPLDAGLAVESILLVMAAWCVLSGILMLLVLRPPAR